MLAPALSLAALREASPRDERIARLDEALSSIRQIGSAPEWKETYRDIRGVIQLDDLQRWVFAPETLAKMSELVEKARGPEANDDALDLAETMMYQASARSMELREYWDLVPKLTWRQLWTAFATANGLKPDAMNAAVLAEEKRLLAALEIGEFTVAARHELALEELAAKAINDSGGEVYRSRKAGDIKFVARATECPAATVAAGKANAQLSQPANPDSWYPESARKRGEYGGIILRARIAASSCATAFAVLVSSGFPELDAAAIQVAEASRYTAANEDGKPVDGELVFKVRFELKEFEGPE